MTHARIPIVLTSGVMAAGMLAGCSTGPETAACDADAITAAARAGLAADGENLLSVDPFACDGTFAYTWATVGDANDSETHVQVTLVFESRDGAWVEVDREAVCGTLDTQNLQARPADAQVPESIWKNACLTD